ncbi:MAG: prepilin peptidase [Myxococcota bacterium]|nr:prepilin peptidase [Myxococcota bacterium]
MLEPHEVGIWGWLGLGVTAAVMVTIVVADLRSARIPNRLTYPAALAGLLLHLGAGLQYSDPGWWARLSDSLLGLSLGFGVLFLGFLFGGIGGGDVKACAALGALAGLGTTASGLIYMGLIGGAMALSIMIWKGKLFRSLLNMGRFFLTALTPGLSVEMPKEENSDPFPLGVAISGGFAWAIVGEGWLGYEPLFGSWV